MQNSEKVTFEAIGTTWVIDLQVKPSFNLDKIIEKVKTRIEEFDKTYSRFRKDSWIYNVFKKPGKHTVPPDFEKLYSIYLKLYHATGGLFTPTIGNLLRDAGYDESYSLKPKKLHEPPRLETILNFDGKILTTHIPVMLDFGAAGKGYIIDLVAEMLQKEKLEHFCVDAGGDIYYYSKENKEISVGLENPSDTSQIIGVSKFYNKSICASAGNRRKWGVFHHIINPKTLKSPEDVISVWVIADQTVIADAMATALFLFPNLSMNETYPCEYLLLFRDFHVQKSKNFPAELFTFSAV